MFAKGPPAVAQAPASAPLVSLATAIAQDVVYTSSLLDLRGGASSEQDDDVNKADQDAKTSPKNKQRSNHHNNHNNHNNEVVRDILEHADDYYHVLGLTRQKASLQEIQKAFRRRSLQTHPDKTGGDRRAFDIVRQAQDVLSDPQRRSIYDRYGVKGLENTHEHSQASSFQDFFQTMFSQYADSASSGKTPRRNPTMRYQLSVSLEDLYFGKTQHVSIPAPYPKRQKNIQIEIPRGCVQGQPIILSGAMDFLSTQQAPGDLIFIIMTEAHPIFTRKNHDLAMELKISLEEALCGMKERSIPHLDGTTLLIRSAMDEGGNPIVISSGDVQVLKGKGFPKSPNVDVEDYGDLYIQFQVEMPKSSTSTLTSSSKQSSHPLDAGEREQLRALLEKLRKGKSSSVADHNKNSNKKTKTKRRKSNKSAEVTTDDKLLVEDHDLKENSQPTTFVHQLIPGKTSNFGVATGTAKIHMDEEHAEYFQDDYSNNDSGVFGKGSSTFFRSFGGSGSGGPTRGFYFGNHPFFGDDGGSPTDDGQHTQCQQM